MIEAMKIDHARDSLKAVVEAANEGLKNLETLDNDNEDAVARDYLRGDIAEMERRSDLASQNVESVCDEAEESDEDE